MENEIPVSKPIRWPLIFLTVIFILAIAAGAYWLGTQNATPNLVAQPTPLPAKIIVTTTTVDSTANWKTYTNSGFGVSFKYPSNIFVYEGNPQAASQYWSNKSNGSAPMELGEDGVWMNLSVTKLDNAGFNFWSNKINADKLGPKTATSSEVLQILNTNGTRGVVYHNLPKPNTEVAYAYTVMWLKDKTAYQLFLAAFTDTNLTLYKSTFDQILATFKFTN